jgi:hypothetical protein
MLCLEPHAPKVVNEKSGQQKLLTPFLRHKHFWQSNIFAARLIAGHIF